VPHEPQDLAATRGREGGKRWRVDDHVNILVKTKIMSSGTVAR
jgi:hypothetical protein